MSDAVGPRLNRRALLAAVTTVGAAGALTGRGAAGLLGDRETLGPNDMTAGAVTLALDGDDVRRLSVGFEVDDYGYDARDETRICLGLGADSNPGWVWLRACPRVPDVEDDLAARVTHDGRTVFDGSLGRLLDRLSAGVLLTEFVGAGETPVSPGPDGAVCLTLAVWAPTALAESPDDVRTLKAASPLGITLDVYAEQSRHVPEPRRPVAGENPSFTFPECPPPRDPPDVDDPPTLLGHAISNVSLCTTDPVDPAAVTWTVRDPGTGADATGVPGEAFAVEASAPVPIDHAVVKAGREFRRTDAGGATTVTVTATGGTLLSLAPNAARCACAGLGVKLDDWSDDDGTFTAVVPLDCGDDGSVGGADSSSSGAPGRPPTAGSPGGRP